jgi:putative colanic acid biosynthesis glycosyltransferase
MTRCFTKAPFSIITVTLNNMRGLATTFASIEAQTVQGLHEWIVIDGASTDGTVDFLHSMPPFAAIWVSRPDDGIYDAMNKAIERAHGEYLIFLNAGDRLAHRDVLDQLRHGLLSRPDRSVWLGRYELCAAPGSRPLLRKSRPPSYLRHGLPTSHQAILYPREIFDHLRYDKSYEICGDYALTAAIWRSGYPFTRIPVTIASFTRDGVSAHSQRTLSTEATQVQREILQLPTWQTALSRGRRWVNTVGLQVLGRLSEVWHGE